MPIVFALPASDIAAQRLHDLGWSYGDISTVGTVGRVCTVYAHKDEQEILTRAPTLAEAYCAGVEQAGAGA